MLVSCALQGRIPLNPGPTPLVLLSYLMLVCAPGGAQRSPALARNYSTISVTTPEPTVRPPSRMAKRRP